MVGDVVGGLQDDFHLVVAQADAVEQVATVVVVERLGRDDCLGFGNGFGLGQCTPEVEGQSGKGLPIGLGERCNAQFGADWRVCHDGLSVVSGLHGVGGRELSALSDPTPILCHKTASKSSVTHYLISSDR